jgi:excisionase family DNA binding protein
MIAPAPAATLKLLLTLPEAAESLSVCERTVSRLISRRELTAIKIGNRGIRIAVKELEAWIARQQAPAEASPQ